MQTLLIADGSESFVTMLISELGTQFQIRTCADGEEALKLLPQYQPDILILNLMLPYVDGLMVLQKSSFRPSLILATTMYMSAYVEQAVHALEIDYTMISPSPEAVAERLRDLLHQYTTIPGDADPNSSITHHLHLLKVPTHLDGYRQLCLALPMFVENPQQLLTKELYPAVAELCSCKDSRAVEHSIRKAIQAAWRHRDNATWHKYFAGNSGACPTNKEFLCRLAEILSAKTGVL